MYYLVSLLFLFLSSCAGLPDYAKPQFVAGAEEAGYSSASFGYRQLTVSDFQADSLPDSFSSMSHRIQARSCITFRPSDDTVINIARGTVSGQQIYFGSFTHFEFQAVFNPKCSWWSPKVPQKIEAYVLQHEQIHFALAELAARQINMNSELKVREYMAFGNDPLEVQDDLVNLAQGISRDAVALELKKHTKFDEETSLVHDPLAQQKWYDEVLRGLEDGTGP